ncbi:MAG: ribosome small subunit-dependent GTPase A [Chromatiales bacterium]|jgi:ribosome biogenesis GTPase|nr:ribosome small subunit-dependent GTPase A [Chromatiales bacterium]
MPGRIVASYGQRGVLEAGDGTKRRYVLKGRRLKAVCGDVVKWTEQKDSPEALVTSVSERSNALERPGSSGNAELIAANLARLLVVLAPAPEPDFFIADRYLCSAELMGANGIVIWNKTDISPDIPDKIMEYQDLGYDMLAMSCETSEGLGKLESILGDGISMLVGQSGVGKSSLINTLVANADAAIGELSEASREGRHTTTASYMHELKAGGKLIDSPGVREFAPVIRDVQQVQAGFREIIRLADQCKFSNCQHLREPDCAVKEALRQGGISSRRYESYKRLCNSVTTLLKQGH